MIIEIIEVGPVVKDGNYFKMQLKYSREGKQVSRNLVALGETKAVVQKLKDAKPGESWDIKLEKVEKNGQEFWNWVGAEKAAADAAPAKASFSKSTYATPEERAQQQVYICRQSSLKAAVEYYALLTDSRPTPEEVISVASRFTSWVMDLSLTEQSETEAESSISAARDRVNPKRVTKAKAAQEAGDIENDIPF